MSDLVGNPEDRFSRVEAHLIPRKHATIFGFHRAEQADCKVLFNS